MAHYPKPFFRGDRGLWYVQLNGKQHNLGREKDDAFRRYHQLMQAPTPVASTLALTDGAHAAKTPEVERNMPEPKSA